VNCLNLDFGKNMLIPQGVGENKPLWEYAYTQKKALGYEK
jgi:hypothetical protein